LAAKEFPAFRLQQFELHGLKYGTTGSVLNYETRLLPGSQIVSSPRRCYLIKLVDLSTSVYRDLLKFSVAGIVIIVPSDFTPLSPPVIEQIQVLEQIMLEETTSVPIYFIKESEEVMEVYKTVKDSAESLGATTSALQTILHHVHGNGVQLVTGSTIGTPKAIADAQVTSIQGALIGSGADKNFPILITSHYDSMSPAAELSFGADSNGSGTTTLLELARIFSHLYTQQSSPSKHSTSGRVGGRPHSSLLFLLSGAGQFNYEGTQKYLEDQLDFYENSDLQETKLVVSLDSLAGVENHLYIHISKQIREGTMLHTFVQNLITLGKELYPEMKIELVPKKVKTENLLSWEHEKFRIKKLNSLTLSSYNSPNLLKLSLLDTKDKVNINDLAKKVHLIAETIAASIYNVSGIGTAFSGSLNVSKTSILSTLGFVASQPRSAQLLATKQNKFVQSLRSLLARYTHETSLFHMKPDKRDANLVFYDTTGGLIFAYDVKPAIFDLVVSLAIAVYVGMLYLIVKSFPSIYDFAASAKVGNQSTNGASLNSKPKEKAQ
jgi:hypothetical protein